MSSSQMTDLEARFGHILQPIRDLTKNWDVDIASYLEEYLDDLERVVVTFNHGETTMNFAEAALLIQGSACVYSKKVEYLYTLVYQVLDMIVHKKKQQKSSVDANGKDHDAEFPEEDKEEFLSLDDTKGAKLEKLQNRDDPEKESRVYPQIPMNLIAHEDGEKGAGEINNHKGELLGNMSDFQMNCSTVLRQGGVFLDSNLLPMLHSNLRLLASSTPYPQHVRHGLEKSGGGDINQDNMPPPPPLPDLSADDGGDGFEPLEPMEAAPADIQPQTEEPPRRCDRKRVQFAVTRKPKPSVDHWALSDPFSNGKLAEKKLKAGQTYKPPAGTGPAPTKKRKRKAPEKKAPIQPISEFVQSRVYSHRPKFPKNPSLVPTFPEFEDMFWKEFKRRQEELRRQKQKLQAVEDVYDGPADDVADQEVEDNNWPVAADNDDEADEADNFEPLQLQLDDNALAPIEACGGDFINSLGSSGSTYEDMVRQHVENFLAQAAKYAQVSELTKRVAEWEEKITPRLQEEEQREPFDIHKYGTKVIESMQRNQRIAFRKIVSGRPIFQICRLFLATLQLANTYNVELFCPGKLNEAMDKLELRLLSTKRHYEELADYQAPSLTVAQ